MTSYIGSVEYVECDELGP